MKGSISQWNDDKGFGFIAIPGKKGKLFFHISNVKTTKRRPQVGDNVDFEIGKGKDGKLKAISVVISGLAVNGKRPSKHIKIEPPKKDVIDYALLFFVIFLLGFAGYQYFLHPDLETVWVYFIPVVIAFFVSARTKKPKQTHFSCAKCKTVEKFTPRTIEAWNKKLTRLYCKACHQEWIRNQPKEDMNYQGHHTSSGCFGSFLIILTFPMVVGLAIFKFFA